MSNEKNNHTYDDIIDSHYPFSLRHTRMPQSNRAAQFSAFAALSGFDTAISETARLTEPRIELDEDAKKILDIKLNHISKRIDLCPVITVDYFVADAKKQGGAYLKHHGELEHIDTTARLLIFADNMRIPIDDIIDIEA